MSIFKQNKFGLFNSLIFVCQNCPIDFKLGMMIHNTVMYNVESVTTR